jgi:hypothetical protein
MPGYQGPRGFREWVVGTIRLADLPMNLEVKQT